MKTQITNIKKKNKKGFSLVELIVVIAILAVLSVTAVMSVGNISNQAADAAAQSDANTIVRALNTYNAMAATQITLNTQIDTSAELQALNLSTTTSPADLIDMNLGVNVDQNRLNDLLGGYTLRAGTGTITVQYDGSMWIVNRT